MKNIHSNIFIIAGFSHALPFPMQIFLFFSFLLHFFFSPSSSLLSSSSHELSRLEHKSNKTRTQDLFITCSPKGRKQKKTFFLLVLLLNIMRFSYLNIIRLFAIRFRSFW